MDEPAILHGLMHGPASYRLIQLKVELPPAWVPPLLRCGKIYGEIHTFSNSIISGAYCINTTKQYGCQRHCSVLGMS